MPEFRAKYSEDERAAIVEAGLDKGIKPISTICRLAAAGELTLKGEKIAPFTIPNPTARGYVEQARRGREGHILSALGSAPPKDALEDMRRRLVNMVDYELRLAGKDQKASKRPKDPDFWRKMARALREIASIPSPEQTRLPMMPGAEANEGTTRNALASSILRAENSKPKPAYIPDLGVGEQVEEGANGTDAGVSVFAGSHSVSHG